MFARLQSCNNVVGADKADVWSIRANMEKQFTFPSGTDPPNTICRANNASLLSISERFLGHNTNFQYTEYIIGSTVLFEYRFRVGYIKKLAILLSFYYFLKQLRVKFYVWI